LRLFLPDAFAERRHDMMKGGGLLAKWQKLPARLIMWNWVAFCLAEITSSSTKPASRVVAGSWLARTICVGIGMPASFNAQPRIRALRGAGMLACGGRVISPGEVSQTLIGGIHAAMLRPPMARGGPAAIRRYLWGVAKR
jgi:hypothetical protein